MFWAPWGANIFGPRAQKCDQNNETKTYTKKSRTSQLAKSCAEAAFCKGVPGASREPSQKAASRKFQKVEIFVIEKEPHSWASRSKNMFRMRHNWLRQFLKCSNAMQCAVLSLSRQNRIFNKIWRDVFQILFYCTFLVFDCWLEIKFHLASRGSQICFLRPGSKSFVGFRRSKINTHNFTHRGSGHAYIPPGGRGGSNVVKNEAKF